MLQGRICSEGDAELKLSAGLWLMSKNSPGRWERKKESVPAETGGGENQHIMKNIMKPAKGLSYVSGK